MKKNLNEELSRIKNMMGLNEQGSGWFDDEDVTDSTPEGDKIDLDTYKEESPIIADVKRVGESDNGNSILSIDLNAFVGDANSRNTGTPATITVTVEFSKDKYGNAKVRNVTDVQSTVKLDGMTIDYIKNLFRYGTMVYEVINRIYIPYYLKFSDDKEYREKIRRNEKEDVKRIERALDSIN